MRGFNAFGRCFSCGNVLFRGYPAYSQFKWGVVIRLSAFVVSFVICAAGGAAAMQKETAWAE